MLTEGKEFYNLKYDRIFKTVVLGDEKYKYLNEILRDILEKEVYVEKIKLNEIPINNAEARIQILDVIVKTKEKEIINVEINTNFNSEIKERNLMYYMTMLIERFKHEKEKEEGIKKIIQINLNHNKKGKEATEEIRIMDKKTKEVYYEEFKVINVNLDKYKRMCYDKNIKGDKEHIYLVALTANKEELKELSKKDKIIKEVGEKVFELNEDEEIRRQMEAERDAKIVYEKSIRNANKAGEEKGVAKGFEKGLKEGVAKGVKEGTINVAKSLIKRQFSIEDIKDITQLSEEEIIKIQKEI